eukprot:scaffold2604_cov198-Alexandrium_tamarense.AAC.24
MNGETVSVDGTHLGHNLPDRKGSRYCINLVCVAGRPVEEGKTEGGWVLNGSSCNETNERRIRWMEREYIIFARKV